MKTTKLSGVDGVTAKPTLKTIAELTGLAVPTVSRALNDAPDIGMQTKKLVREVADKIGYVPNRAGVRLRTGRTQVISLIISTEHEIMNHTARMISSIAGALRETPFHLNVTPYFPEDDPMKPVRHVVENGLADGIILNQIQPRDPRVQYLRDRAFPFATHGRTETPNAHPYFDFDNLAYGRIGTRKLLERGRRNIAVLAPPLDQTYAQHIVSGTRDIAEPAGATVRVIDGATTNSPHDVIQSAVHEHLAIAPNTDAIISSSASGAMVAVAALEAEGRELGIEVDVVGKESLPILTLFRPRIIAVSENVTMAGAFLARAVLQAILHPEEPPMQGLDIPSG
ncbi:LacI family transcriptional regulator [Pelagovum pacificum]|uniref:LacI family transcriptional regulator n=1 Tax=Pelagovum pacificum TaxID=2588711 RepID=UPI001E5846CC|nr:LacI family transcriptional regulator [Pelagovum pacificum]